MRVMMITRGLENKARREIERYEANNHIEFKEVGIDVIVFDYRGNRFKVYGDGEITELYPYDMVKEHTIGKVEI